MKRQFHVCLYVLIEFLSEIFMLFFLFLISKLHNIRYTLLN